MQRIVNRIFGLEYQDGSPEDEDVADMISRSSSSLDDGEDNRVVSTWEECREDVRTLLEAAQSGNAHGVLAAVQQNVSVDSTGENGLSALHLACEANRPEIVQLLMYHGCNLNLPARSGEYAVHIAARHGNTSCLRCLLLGNPIPTHHADVNAEDMDERTALHIAADSGAAEVVACLLLAKPNLDLQDMDSSTPLILAASHGYTEIVTMLGTAGCDMDQRNLEGRTALMEASIGNHLAVAQELVQFGCHINVMDKHGYTALSDAVCGGRLSMVDILLQAGADVNIQDSRGRSALHISILYGYNTIASRLLSSGAKINLQDEDGFTAIYLAAWDPWKRGTLPILTHLALLGANLDIPDNDHTPPIVKAWNQAEHVATLVQHGCNINIKTKHGFSLVELAAMQDNFELAAALLSAGAKPPKPSIFAEPRTKYNTEYNVLQNMCSTPLCLKEQSRLVIRKSVSQNCTVFNGIESLPLPLLMKNYLMMTEMPAHPHTELMSNSVRGN